MQVTLPIEAKDIQKLIPHRYPFMLLDRITAFESGKSLTALKKYQHERTSIHGAFSRFSRDAWSIDY